MGVEASEFVTLKETLANTQGDVVIMFSGELSAAAQTILAQLPFGLSGSGRVLLHPLPLFNNSIGAHDMGMMNGAMSAAQMLDAAGDTIRAMYVAGSFLEAQLEKHRDALAKLDFLVGRNCLRPRLQTCHVVFRRSLRRWRRYDTTGCDQRVRQSIAPVQQLRETDNYSLSWR